jgi:hypothetical protein
MASGINSTFRQVGIATGIAALGALFQSELSKRLAPKLAGTSVAGHAGQIAHAVAAGGAQGVIARVPRVDRAEAVIAVHGAFAASLNEILLVGSIVAFVGAALAFAMIRGRDFAVYTAREGIEHAPAIGTSTSRVPSGTPIQQP